ncbi:transposase [Bacteroides sp. 224]|nr:transposase [Bacteroides sp. 224]
MPPMYKVLSKDTITNEIIPHLPVAKRGFKTTSYLVEMVNCILYKLKTGIQWEFLPVESLFSNVVLSYKTVFGHFRNFPLNENIGNNKNTAITDITNPPIVPAAKGNQNDSLAVPTRKGIKPRMVEITVRKIGTTLAFHALV